MSDTGSSDGPRLSASAKKRARRKRAAASFTAMESSASSVPAQPVAPVASCALVAPTVTIAPSPGAVLLGADEGGTTLAFTATGVPEGGTYAWAVQRTDCGVQVQGAADAAGCRVISQRGGSATLVVTYTTAGGVATDTVAAHFVAVTVAPTPGAVALVTVGTAVEAQMTATGTPAGGTYLWALASSDNTSAITGGTGTAGVKVSASRTGTAKLTVSYTAHGLRAQAAVDAHFVGVRITDTEPFPLMVRIPTVDPDALAFGRFVFHAAGTPAGGVYNWPNPPSTDRVRYAGTTAHGDVNQATLEGASAGTGAVRVEYTLHGVTAKAAVAPPVEHILCSAVRWLPSGGNVTPGEPLVVCTHEPLQAYPPSTVRHRHYYGGICDDCSGAATPRYVRHRVPVSNGEDAEAQVIRLGNEILEYIALSGSAKTEYAATRAWLDGISTAEHFVHYSTKNKRREACGKMFGFLIARNAANTLLWLHGISGTKAVMGSDDNPNPWWSPPLARPHEIPSATRGSKQYANAANRVKGWETFGRCAASAMLAQALALKLEIIAMAEVYIKPSGQHQNRWVDGRDVTPSCENCRRYLGRMLCEYGRGAR